MSSGRRPDLELRPELLGALQKALLHGGIAEAEHELRLVLLPALGHAAASHHHRQRVDRHRLERGIVRGPP
eukprot:1544541-Pyramimonas_sp.AAC.1